KERLFYRIFHSELGACATISARAELEFGLLWETLADHESANVVPIPERNGVCYGDKRLLDLDRRRSFRGFRGIPRGGRRAIRGANAGSCGTRGAGGRAGAHGRRAARCGDPGARSTGGAE